MIIWTRRLLEARDFFREAHDSIGQIRKYSRDEYWTHTERTTATFSTTFRYPDYNEDLLIGQLGHDYVEDVVPKNAAYTTEMVLERFGPLATSHMLDLTDVYTAEAYPLLNRKKRKELERIRLSKVPIKSKDGKVSDIADNTSSIVENDENFARIYLQEIHALMLVLEGGDKVLYDEVYAQVIDGMKKLNLDIPMRF